MKPNRITPLQLFEISENLTVTRSLILTGRALNVIPLQKLSYRFAIVPSRDILILSP